MKHKKNQKDWTKEEREKIPPTPYTNSKAGQVRFGGWTTEGTNKFSEFKKLIAEARQVAYVPVLEKMILEIVRKNSGQEELDKKRENSKSGKKGKAKVSQAQVVELDADMDNWE